MAAEKSGKSRKSPNEVSALEDEIDSASALAGDGKPRRTRLDLEERRAQLLALGRRAFAERSYDDVSIDDIARAAGISKGLLYHYFPTKRDLYVAGLRVTSDELVELATTVRRDMPPIDRLRAGIDSYLDNITSEASAYIALMRGGVGSDPEIAEIIEGTRSRLIKSIMSDASETNLGALFAQQPVFRLVLRGWIGFVEATSIEWLSKPDCDRERLREIFVSMLQATLLAVGAPPAAVRY